MILYVKLSVGMVWKIRVSTVCWEPECKADNMLWSKYDKPLTPSFWGGHGICGDFWVGFGVFLCLFGLLLLTLGCDAQFHGSAVIAQ